MAKQDQTQSPAKSIEPNSEPSADDKSTETEFERTWDAPGAVGELVDYDPKIYAAPLPPEEIEDLIDED